MYIPLLYHSNYGRGGSSFETLFETLNKYNLKSCGIVDETFFGLPEFITLSKKYNIKPTIGARIVLPAPHCESSTQFKENLCQSRTVIARSPAKQDAEAISPPAFPETSTSISSRDSIPKGSVESYIEGSLRGTSVPKQSQAGFGTDSAIARDYPPSGGRDRGHALRTRNDKNADFSITQSKLYLFIKNQQGYENLCQILTKQAFTQLDLEYIKEHRTGLVALSNSIALLKKLRDAFSREIFYLVLPYHTRLRNEFPPIAANEIFYVTKQEKILYKLMSTIKNYKYEHKKGIPNHLLTDQEFKRIFADYPQTIINSEKLSEICNFVPGHRSWVFPESKQDLYEIIKSKIKNLQSGEKARIQFEYQIIKNTGFEPYFSLVYHLKEFALSKGIGMNVRGSAASSFILYVLGLSIINPIKYNLPFERFLNPQRIEPPDIDVDVEFSQRERLIQEIYKEFGNDYVAHISSINRFQSRARFRDTARAYGISPQELKNIRNHLGEKIFRDINNISKQIDNYPHYFSCHASGIIITPKPVNRFVPLYPSPAGQITHFDKDGIEMVGLVKMDILGVRGFPSLYLSREKIDFDDQNVYKFISENKTLGCFQIESPMVRQILQKVKPKSLMDIANAIAVIRPGPAYGGMKERFLKRLKGEEKIEYPHPTLELALKETLGIPIYQEQILQISHDFANFSLSDGDMLRRAMTKERESNRMKELEDLFFDKAMPMQHSKKEIEMVWTRIKAFSSFGFNKAHSLTYATLAYLSAYQKLYEPLEFFCRVINNKGGYYPSVAYINEARRWGIKILAPDVNKSEVGFSIINNFPSHATSYISCHSDPERPPPCHSDPERSEGEESQFNTVLITGLAEIKNLSSSAIERIIKFRPFKNPQEFFYYVRPSIDEGVSLIKSGSLDTFGQSWPELYFLLLSSKLQSVANSSKKLLREARFLACHCEERTCLEFHRESDEAISPLSTCHCEGLSPEAISRKTHTMVSNLHLLTDKVPEFKEFDNNIKLNYQLETLGFLPACHILEAFFPNRESKIADLKSGIKSTIIGTPITYRPILTKNKKLMSFLTIDDETGVLEVVIFPDKYKSNAIGPIMEIQGAIKDDSFIAEKCYAIRS